MSAPIIVAASLGTADFAYVDGLRKLYFPPERNQLDAHLTLFHHLPPSSGDALKVRLAEESRAKAPPAELSGLLNLGRGVAFRVRSPELDALRGRLADAFHGLLTPQDQAGWRAHVTVQNKVDPSHARETLRRLEADFEPRPLKIAGLAAYWYRGGPWEPFARYYFRG